VKWGGQISFCTSVFLDTSTKFHPEKHYGSTKGKLPTVTLQLPIIIPISFTDLRVEEKLIRYCFTAQQQQRARFRLSLFQ
jgi:hypothetical protein